MSSRHVACHLLCEMWSAYSTGPSSQFCSVLPSWTILSGNEVVTTWFKCITVMRVRHPNKDKKHHTLNRYLAVSLTRTWKPSEDTIAIRASYWLVHSRRYGDFNISQAFCSHRNLVYNIELQCCYMTTTRYMNSKWWMDCPSTRV